MNAMEKRTAPELAHWRERVSRDLDYFLDTEEGRKELSEMVKAETDAILEYIRTSRPRVRDVIWLSQYCRVCARFNAGRRGYMRCEKHDARLVKPFFGKPIWATVVTTHGEKELLVTGVDWNAKSFDISDMVIEEAIARINGGDPYRCFETKP